MNVEAPLLPCPVLIMTWENPGTLEKIGTSSGDRGLIPVQAELSSS